MTGDLQIQEEVTPGPGPVPLTDAWEKKEFLAMLGHDLRTPLGMIEGFLELLADTPLDAERRDWVETARESAQDLRETLEGLLECLRSDAGQMILHETPRDLPAFLASVLRGFQAQAKRNHLGLRLELAENMPKYWIFDAAKLRQILHNLLGNALKFSSAGEVILYAKASDSGGVLLLVDDSGPGIPENMRPHVFEAFLYGSPQLPSGSRDGYGLGLAIVKRLVQTMKGNVSLHDRNGTGTRVLLEFPWKQGTSPQ